MTFFKKYFIRYGLLIFFLAFFVLASWRFILAAMGDPYIEWMRFYDSGGTASDKAHGIAAYNSNDVSVPPPWPRTFNGGSTDYANDVAVDPTGNVYVTGVSTGATSYDFVTVKYDSQGSELWRKSFDSGGYDAGQAITLDGAGNVYVTGSSGSGSYRTLKYDAGDNRSGNTVTAPPAWNKNYTVSFGAIALGIAVDNAGNVYVTGGNSSNVASDYLTIKYNAGDNLSGDNTTAPPAWSKTYDEGNIDAAQGIAVDPAGNVYVTGRARKSPYTSVKYQYLTLKYNAGDNRSGNKTAAPPAWNKRFRGADSDVGADIVIDSPGNLYVAGFSYNGTNYDYRTIKYNAGDTQSGTPAPAWDKIFDSGNSDTGEDIAIDALGNLYVTGSFHNGTNYDYRTIKYNAGDNRSGNQAVAPPAWNKIFDSVGQDDTAYGIAADSSGDVYVTGSSGIGADYLTIKYSPLGAVYVVGTTSSSTIAGQILKYDPSGDFLWNRAFNATSTGEARAAVVDSQGFLYAAGYSSNGTNDDIRVIKYDSSGTPVPGWDKSYNGAANADDRAYAIALDSKGNVYVAGGSCTTSSNCSSTNWKYRVIKYSSSTAGVLWNSLDVGSTTYEIARGIAIDSLDRVYVTGDYWNVTNSNFDYHTLRYNSSTGALDPTFNRTDNSGGFQQDMTAGVAVDKVGNVYVGGYVLNQGQNSNVGHQLYKYNSSGGTVWSKFISPPTGALSLYDAGGVGVDSENNFYMTWGDGLPIGQGSNYDYVLVKFASSSGNEMWQKRVDSGKDSFSLGQQDRSRALATDPYGNIYLTGDFQYTTPSANVDIMTVKLSKFTGAGPACGFPLDASSTNWTDPALPNPLKMRKPYIDELRAWINNQRQDVGTSTFVWVDPIISINNSTRIRKVHFDEMQRAISDVYSICSTSTPAFTDAPFTVSTRIRGTHVNELRNAIQNAP